MAQSEWQWDETLFLGAAPYYVRGRLPYAPRLAAVFADALSLDGRGRLIDVGCGPGIVALRVAHLFAEVVGLDPDAGMLAEAQRRAAEQGVTNTGWVKARAEDLPVGPGTFRVATFAASFHWMDRLRVAALVREALEPGGAFVQVTDVADEYFRVFGEQGLEPAESKPEDPLPYPAPPHEAIEEIKRRYLGSERRAGRGVVLTSPNNEAGVLAAAGGYEEPRMVIAGGREVILRTPDDILAWYHSSSGAAPHLFGERLAEFDAEVRRVLGEASPAGLFAERTNDTRVIIWRRR